MNNDFKISRTLKEGLSEQHLFSSSSAPWQQQILREVLSRLNFTPETKCLDAACGVGNNIRSLLQYSSAIYAIDRSQLAIDFAIKRYQENSSSLSFFQGQIESLPFESQMFDLVVCTEALEHIPDIEVVIKELTRVLKEGGTLIISFQNYLNLTAIIKPVMERITQKNWDAWGTHDHEGGFERHLNYFTVKGALNKMISMRIVEVRGADYINAWLNWVPGIRKNYNLLDRFPLFFVGKLPLLKLLGMDCFIVAQKQVSY